MPEPAPVPDHWTGKLAPTVAGSGSRWLTGESLSIVLTHSGVSIGGLTSKTMRARSLIWVPVASPRRGMTE
jgi:hypothetical protein